MRAPRLSLLSLLLAPAGSYHLHQAVHSASRSRVATASATASRPVGEGNYAVGGGAWGTAVAPAAAAPPRPGRRGSPGRGGRGKGRSGRGSPVVHNVLRKMAKLDSSATLDEVDGVLSGQKLTPRDYTTVLAALKTRRAWRVTLRVGEWMRRRSAAASEGAAPLLPNRAHYQVMLGACASSGETQAAQTVVEEMGAAGIPIDATAIGTLIFAHEKAGDWASTLPLLNQIDALTPDDSTPATAPTPLPRQPEGAPPLIGQHGANAAAAAPRDRDVLAPHAAADALAFAYASAIRAHESGGRWKAALDLFERAQARGVVADEHVYAAALGACRRGGEAQRAIGLLAQAKAAGVAPNGVMYTVAMAACNAAKDWESSLSLLEERRLAVGLDAYAYAVAMGACATGRQWETALTLLEEMNADEGTRANAFAWNNAMVACNRAAQHEKALELYDRMRHGACALSEHSIAAALVACRHVSGWQRAQAIYDGSKGLGLSSVMCTNALLDVLSDGEQWQLLLAYFDAMRGAGGVPTEHSYERAIEACDRVDSERALVLFEEMRAAE